VRDDDSATDDSLDSTVSYKFVSTMTGREVKGDARPAWTATAEREEVRKSMHS
jgi:hypothetical protein